MKDFLNIDDFIDLIRKKHSLFEINSVINEKIYKKEIFFKNVSEIYLNNYILEKDNIKNIEDFLEEIKSIVNYSCIFSKSFLVSFRIKISIFDLLIYLQLYCDYNYEIIGSPTNNNFKILLYFCKYSKTEIIKKILSSSKTFEQKKYCLISELGFSKSEVRKVL